MADTSSVPMNVLRDMVDLYFRAEDVLAHNPPEDQTKRKLLQALVARLGELLTRPATLKSLMEVRAAAVAEFEASVGTVPPGRATP